MIYCNYFPLKDEDGAVKISSNVNFNLTHHFKFLDDSASAFLFYAYAVLSSPSYLDTFEGILYGHSDPSSPVRLPISACKILREDICVLGQKIALCEKTDHIIYFAKKYVHDDIQAFADFRLTKHKFDEEQERLILFGDNGNEFKIEGIASDLVGLKIAGHNVIDKWLRERKFAYLKRAFNNSDLVALLDTLSRIQYQQALIVQVDRLVDKMISSNDLIHPLNN